MKLMKLFPLLNVLFIATVVIVTPGYSSGDGNQSCWSLVAPHAPWSAREGMVVAVFKDRMWVIGGHVGNYRMLNDVWSTSDGLKWREVTGNAPWKPRRLPTVEVFNGKIWLMGGLHKEGEVLNDVWFSEDGKNWTQATDNAPWCPRAAHASAVFDSKVWVMGGAKWDTGFSYLTNSDFKNDVWKMKTFVSEKSGGTIE